MIIEDAHNTLKQAALPRSWQTVILLNEQESHTLLPM